MKYYLKGVGRSGECNRESFQRAERREREEKRLADEVWCAPDRFGSTQAAEGWKNSIYRLISTLANFSLNLFKIRFYFANLLCIHWIWF